MTTQGTILVADNDAGIVNLLVEVFTDEGYAVQTVATGAAALAAVLADRPDLALIDLHLPGMSGLDVLNAVDAAGIDVPMVIMTAAIFSEDDLAAIGTHASLNKPFDVDDLLTCVAQHIRRR